MKMVRQIGLIALVGVVLVMGCKQGTCCGVDKKPSKSQYDDTEAEKAVLMAHGELVAAAQKQDIETMFSYILENDKGAIIQNGQLLSRQESLQQVQQAFERLADIQYDFEQRNVKMLSPTIALMTATGTTTSTSQTGQSFTSPFANTSVFVLQEDGWKIIHGHHSIPNRN
jgi:hypothetical protein